MRGAACAIAASLALAGAASAGPPAAPVPAGAIRELDVSVVRGGALTRYRVDGERLVVRVPPDEIAVSRTLQPEDRDRLRRAVGAVLDDSDTQFTCRGAETFVAVTLDGRTNWNALCPGAPVRPGWGAKWLVLLVVIEEIGGRRDLPAWGPVR